MKKLAKTFLVLMLVVGMMVTNCGISVAAAETDNLLPTPGFEGDTVAKDWKVSDGLDWTNVLIKDADAAYEGEQYIYLEEKSTYIHTAVDVEANTTYKLSVYTKFASTSAARVTFNSGAGESHWDLNPSDTWSYQQSLYTTAEDATKLTIMLRARGTSTSTGMVSYDKAVLTKATDEDLNNLVTNSDLEIDRDGSWRSGDTTNVSIVNNTSDINVAAERGNCVKMVFTADKPTMTQVVKIEAGQQYMLTFRFMTTNIGIPRIQIGGSGDGSSALIVAETTHTEGTWYDYTAYFTLSATKTMNLALKNEKENSTVYYDDIKLVKLADTVTYHAAKPVEYKRSATQDYYSFLYYSRSEALSAVQSGKLYAFFRLGNGETAKPFTGIACIYQYKGGVKTLYDVKTVNVELSNGYTSVKPQPDDRIAKAQAGWIELDVPAATEDVTYRVESFMWDSISGLKSYANKSVLQ